MLGGLSIYDSVEASIERIEIKERRGVIMLIDGSARIALAVGMSGSHSGPELV